MARSLPSNRCSPRPLPDPSPPPPIPTNCLFPTAKSYFNLAQIMPMFPKGPSADGNSILVQSQGVDVEEALKAAPLVARNARYSLPAQVCSCGGGGEGEVCWGGG